ncbi:hypothetical protein OG948_57130 (plasmid) [Embleya sp. NBC_00888]|uniref:hypothetical protein n=1 Tax=Embleya sp. NBC_00888 TaxID=2975960 RepID=UPI002F90DBE9|nr:hypothetical protein OG948_57130 [Embleya sp. NBC_00888]
MDGFAVVGVGPWRVVGQALAGRAWIGDGLAAGCAVAVSTGAVVPRGARALLPIDGVWDRAKDVRRLTVGKGSTGRCPWPICSSPPPRSVTAWWSCTTTATTR